MRFSILHDGGPTAFPVIEREREREREIKVAARIRRRDVDSRTLPFRAIVKSSFAFSRAFYNAFQGVYPGE